MHAAASSASDAEADGPQHPHGIHTRLAARESAAKSFDSASKSATTVAKRKLAAPRKRPKRKTRTSEVRRDEIDLLQKESKYLESKVTFLKHRAGVHDQQALNKQAMDNALFRESLRNQQYALAGLKSAVATDSSDHIPSPLSTRICLGTDPNERRAQLLAIKAQKVHDAQQFLAKRTQFLDLSQPYSDLTRSLSSIDGTVCAAKLDVVPLYSATSVKQVFDTLLYYALNVEMSTADVNGDVVVREEDDTGDESVSQNRFVFLKQELGVQVETNNAIFCQYTGPAADLAESAESAESDEGIITVDFVDQDALYPYRPAERLRDNVTAVFSVKAYITQQQQSPLTQQSPKRADSNHEQQQQRVVVLTRWFQAKFHPTSLPIPVDTLFDLRKEMDHVSDAAITLVRARFRTPPALAFVP